MAAPRAARSGLFQAGRILILVGAILSAFAALVMILLAIFFFAFPAILEGGGEDAAGFGMFAWMAVVYLVLGLLGVGGAIVGFLAFARASRGEARKAWILGLVASLLPPVQLLLLTGAILCLTSPEGQASGS